MNHACQGRDLVVASEGQTSRHRRTSQEVSHHELHAIWLTTLRISCFACRISLQKSLSCS